MNSGVVHIISEIGGCVIGRAPDNDRIMESLHKYARRQDMAELVLLDPSTDDLDGWADMCSFAVSEHRIEGPVLVGTREGSRVLVGVQKRYGYPAPGAPLHDIYRVFRFPT